MSFLRFVSCPRFSVIVVFGIAYGAAVLRLDLDGWQWLLMVCINVVANLISAVVERVSR